jgi:hypothetical protein
MWDDGGWIEGEQHKGARERWEGGLILEGKKEDCRSLVGRATAKTIDEKEARLTRLTCVFPDPKWDPFYNWSWLRASQQKKWQIDYSCVYFQKLDILRDQLSPINLPVTLCTRTLFSVLAWNHYYGTHELEISSFSKVQSHWQARGRILMICSNKHEDYDTLEITLIMLISQPSRLF